MGYDITDYCDVDAIHGTLTDFDLLLTEAHDRGLRVIVDLVPNHTSDQHPWFIDSRGSVEAKHRDWYHWRPGRPAGAPPNNWRGQTRPELGGAWVYDKPTGQWYLANFSPAQPELNWANPAVRSAMTGVVDFWVNRGVDGFRIDMVDFLGKDLALRDEEPAEDVHPRDRLVHARYQLNQPENLEYVGALRQAADKDTQRLLIGEVLYHLPIDRLAAWSAPGLLDLPTNFRLTFLDFTSSVLRDFLETYDAELQTTGGWPNYCLGNHDSPRFTKLGVHATAAMVVLLTLRGTAFLYYGDEIGMTNVDIDPADLRDIWAAAGTGRDGCRTPMQWSEIPNAGFTTPDARPWLPVGSTANGECVDAQRADPESMLALTRGLIQLRRRHPALAYGSLHFDDAYAPPLLAYRRRHASGDVLMIANLGNEVVTTGLPAGQTLLATHTSAGGSPPSAAIAPGGAIVHSLDEPNHARKNSRPTGEIDHEGEGAGQAVGLSD